MSAGRRPVALWLPSPVLWLAAAILVAGLALGGWAIGRQLRGAPTPPPAATGPLEVRGAGVALRADASWSRQRPTAANAIPGLERSLAFGPYPGLPTVVRAGLLPTRSATLLPPSLAAVSDRPNAVRLAGRSAWQYRGLEVGRWLLDASVIPTTAGVVTVVCGVPASAAAPPADCLDGLQDLAPLRGGALAPMPQTALRLRLPAVLRRLDRARRAAAPGLRARSTSSQAAAARRLAAAHRAAAAAVGPFVPAAGAGAGLRRELDAVASAYRRLAAAGAGRDIAAWSRARTALRTAEAALARSLSALRSTATS